MTRPLRPALLLLVLTALTAACAAPVTPTPSTATASSTATVALPTASVPSAAGSPIAASPAPASPTDPTPGRATPPTTPATEGTVEGTILDAAGFPVPGVQVQASQPSTGTAFCCAEMPEPGRYRLSLAPGAYELTFAAPGYLPETRTITVAAGQRVPLDVFLTPGEPTTDGRVLLTVVPDAPPAEVRTVEQVVDGGLQGRWSVTGHLIGRVGSDVELCAAVLESFPPQCGRPAIVVLGFDLRSAPGVQQANGVLWLDRAATLTGDIRGAAPPDVVIP